MTRIPSEIETLGQYAAVRIERVQGATQIVTTLAERNATPHYIRRKGQRYIVVDYPVVGQMTEYRLLSVGLNGQNLTDANFSLIEYGSAAPTVPAPRLVTGATTVTADDVRAQLLLVNASAETAVVLPLPAEMPDLWLDIAQRGTGAVALSAASGATLSVEPGFIAKSAGRNSTLRVRKVSGTEWLVTGRLQVDPATVPTKLAAPVLSPTSRTWEVGGMPAGAKLFDITNRSSYPAGADLVLVPNDGRAVFNSDKSAVLAGSTAIGQGTLGISVQAVPGTASGYSASDSATFTATVTAAQVPDVPPNPITSVSTVQLYDNTAAATPLFTVTAPETGVTRSDLSDARAVWNAAKTQAVLAMGVTLTAGQSFAVSFTDTRNGKSTTRSVTIQVAASTPDGTARTAVKLADFTVVGNNAPVGRVITHGQPLMIGDLRNSETLELRRSGTPLVTQCDPVDNPYADGTRRFAVLSAPLPAVLAVDATETWEVWRKPKPGTAPTPMDFFAKLGLHTCTVKFTNGSNTATINVLDPALYDSARWFSGPNRVQARASQNIPTAAVGGNADPRLVWDIAAFGGSDDTLEIDFCVRNDLCYMPRTQGGIAYRMEITANGQKIADYNVTNHTHKTRFTRLRRFTTAGAVVPRPSGLKVDLDYWSRTGLISNVDRQLGVTAQVLQREVDDLASSGWDVPFSNRGLKTDMGGVGGSWHIGEITRSGVVALMYGTPATLRHAEDQAEAYDGLPIHFFDSVYGNFVNAIERPYSRTNVSYIQPADKLYGIGATVANWEVDIAHWGDVNIVPYLIFGRRTRLDELHAMGHYNIMSRAGADFERGDLDAAAGDADTEAGRLARINYLKNTGTRGAWLFNGDQIRGKAWGIRQTEEAAALVPPGEQARGPFLDIIMAAHNRDQLSRIPQLTAAQGSVMKGWPAWSEYGGGSPVLPPWQMMMLAEALLKQALMRFPGAVDQFEFLMGFLITMGMDRLNRDGSLYSGLNVGTYNLLMLKQPAGSTDYYNAAHLIREPQLALNAGGNKFYSHTGASDFPWVDDQGASHMDSGTDYHARWISLLAKAYDGITVLGRDTTRITQAQKAASEWVQANFYLDADSFRDGGDNGVQLSYVMRGTTRATQGSLSQVAPGAALPAQYPIPFEEPLPLVGGGGNPDPGGEDPGGEDPDPNPQPSGAPYPTSNTTYYMRMGVRRTVPNYTGNLVELTAIADSEVRTFGMDANGDLDRAAVTSWLNGKAAGSRGSYITKFYNQEKAGDYWDVASAALRPRFTKNDGTFYYHPQGKQTVPGIFWEGGKRQGFRKAVTDFAAGRKVWLAMAVSVTGPAVNFARFLNFIATGQTDDYNNNASAALLDLSDGGHYQIERNQDTFQMFGFAQNEPVIVTAYYDFTPSSGNSVKYFINNSGDLNNWGAFATDHGDFPTAGTLRLGYYNETTDNSVQMIMTEFAMGFTTTQADMNAIQGSIYNYTVGPYSPPA